MFKYLGLSFSYILYLLILGQGCSALKGVDHVVTVPIPNFDSIKEIRSVSIPELKVTNAPAKKEIKASDQIIAIDDPALDIDKLEKELDEIEKELTPSSSKLSKPEVVERRPIEQPKLEPIKKDIKKLAQTFEEIKYKEEEKAELENDEVKQLIATNSSEQLNNDPGIQHYGFEATSEVELVSYEVTFASGIESLLAQIEEDALNSEASVPTNAMALNQDSPLVKNTYDPSDPSLLSSFSSEKIDLNEIQDIVKKKEASTEKSDELVMINYEEAKPKSPANSVISDRVNAAIERELKPSALNLSNVPMVTQVPTVKSVGINPVIQQIKQMPTPGKRASKKNVQKSRLTIIALEGDIGHQVSGTVQNFSFIPSFDDGLTIQDFNEGEIYFDYSLLNESGMVRGAVVKNHFVRTTVELPLGAEYSKVEVPLLTQESLSDFIDKHELSGYGGFFLIDLGELLQDVEIEQLGKKNGQTYERRFFLDENLKVVGEGGNFRYVFFAGVVPGNININYLGVNGQETSKLGFVAPDEVTFDMSILQRPIEYSFSTNLQHTLGKTTTKLDLDVSRIVNVEDGKNPEKVAPGQYVLKTNWSIKGTRTYVELGHLDDSIFVGIDGDKKLELPSLEFVRELLTNFRLDSLNNECVLQVNFSQKVKNVQVFGENARGPAVFDLSYLDKDGIFTPELSPLTEKLLLLGNEEGIFNVFVEYENGAQDYLKSFCTTSAYLLEQL